MSLELYYEIGPGTWAVASNMLRADSLEINLHAAEASVGESTIELDDPTGSWYIAGLKAMYLQETDAIDDDWFGIIGPLYTWGRDISRGDSLLTESARLWSITVRDVNTLLTRRLQKGGDAERDEETDVARMQWLVATAEVIGGGGDNGFTIEDTDFLFTDSPVTVGETDYTGQDSAGVIDDVLQDSGKNAYLFNAPIISTEPIRVGIWFGRTERTEYASPHRISNVLSDVDADAAEMAATMSSATLLAGSYTFAPSKDATLNRDPSRIASGAMVQYDGGYVYESRPATASNFSRKDMVFQAELVKTSAQASRRAQRYLRDLREEDDAIECAVQVPSALINGFREGQRVEVRFSHLPGYRNDFVWMRIARRTIRQTSKDSRIYDLALDLRAESPPESQAATGGGLSVCTSQTASTTWYPLGGSGNTPNASNGHIFYWRAGLAHPKTVAHALSLTQGWHFPEYGAGGVGTTDYAGDCTGSRLVVIVEGSGTLTINTATKSGNVRNLRAYVVHHKFGDGQDGNFNSGVDVTDATYTTTTGNSFVIPITSHNGQHCVHWVDVVDIGPTCGSKYGWTSAVWVAS